MPENPRVEELRRRVELDPASIAFAALAEEYRRMGRHEEAIEACRQGLQRHPAYLSARVTLGRALIEVGDFDGARAELETVLKSAPENLAAIRGLAQIHDRLGHSTEMHPDLAALAAAPMPVPPTPPPPPEPEPKAEPADARETPIVQLPQAPEPSPPIADAAGTASLDAAQTRIADVSSGDAVEFDLDINLAAESRDRASVDVAGPALDEAYRTPALEMPALNMTTAARASVEQETNEPAADTGSIAAPEIDAPPAHSEDEFEADPRLARLERFLTAVQHARTAASQTSALR
ncbi:MAG: tetratricopeptide repeat protein [Vicinamibacterales bacterium]